MHICSLLRYPSCTFHALADTTDRDRTPTDSHSVGASTAVAAGVMPPTVVSEFRHKALREFDVEFEVGREKFAARFDSLLMGHDNWVYVSPFLYKM